MDRGAWFILRGQMPAQPLPARFSLSKAPGVPGSGRRGSGGKEQKLMDMMCSRCKKRLAVVFMTRLEGDKTIYEGLCLRCAKELGLKPVSDLMEKMGITDDELDNMSDQMMDMFGGEGENGFEMGGAQALPFLQNILGAVGNGEIIPQKPKEEKDSPKDLQSGRLRGRNKRNAAAGGCRRKSISISTPTATIFHSRRSRARSTGLSAVSAKFIV